MILADHSGEYEYMEKPAFAADDNGKLCEPIRRQAQISPIKCLSPRQVVRLKIKFNLIIFFLK